MADIKLKKSSVVGRIPTASQLDYGELALNYADKKLYFKDTSNNIEEVGAWSISDGTNTGEVGAGETVNFNFTGGVTAQYVTSTNTFDINVTSGIPSQTGHSGKYLTTDGTNASWGSVSGGSSSVSTAISSLVTYTGNGTTTIYTIGSTPVSINNVFVTLNGVSQTPGVDFTISGSDLTFTTTPISGDSIVIRDNISLSASAVLTTNTRYHYIATSATTTITGADDNGLTLAVDPQNVYVFLNGIKLIHDDDYTVNTAGSTITLSSALAVSDELEVHSLGTTSVLKVENAEELGLLHSIQASTRLITSSTTANQVIESVPIATFQSCKYTISAKEGSDVHMTEINAIHDGSNVHFNEYGAILSNAALGTFTVDINSGMMRLLVTPASSATTTFTVHRTGIET